MAAPIVEVLRVCKLPDSDELVQRQYESSHDPDDPAGADERQATIRTLLESVVLIELRVRNRDNRYDIGDFTQPFPDRKRSDWHVAYCEAYLSSDGESVIDLHPFEVPQGDLRLAFYLHDWDLTKPLRTSYGKVMCPTPVAMPERLRRLVPFALYD